MSATGLKAFDKTLQTTNIWLDEIMAELGPDRQVAWKVLSTVLHKLRDKLPIGLAAHLGAELPLLVRGAYYDQFEPARMPVACDTREAFTAEVAEWLSDTRPVDPDAAVGAVFGLLSRHLAPGQIDKVCQALPKPLRDWFEGVRAAPPSPGEPMGAGNRNAGERTEDGSAEGGNSAFFGDRTTLTGTADANRAADMMKDRDSADRREPAQDRE